MRIKLITDSSADLPDKIISKYNIRIVPLKIIFSDSEYYDKFDITPKEFFEKLVSSKDMPTTSQVTPFQFEEAFKEELKSADKIICVTIGANASGTYQSAQIAKNSIDSEDIVLIDSESLCTGTGLLVIEIAKMIEKGLELDNIIANANALKSKVDVLFCVDTLKYLQKGGRIKPTEAFIGGLLNIKPILSVDKGITQTISKARGRNKVLEFFIDHIKNTIDEAHNDYIIVGHGQDEEFAGKLIDRIKQDLKWDKEIILTEIGATIGTHSGPGILAIMYIKK